MIYIILGLVILNLILTVLLLTKKQDNSSQNDLSNLRMEIQNSLKNMSDMLSETQVRTSNAQDTRLKELTKGITDNLAAIETRIRNMQTDNNAQLEKMRETVDEKLQKTLEERISKSFKAVNDHLEEVYKGLGEMKNLASGVGDLKKVLSNVKTRGILGEIQLGSILEQIFSPEQYVENATVKTGSKNVVEFAVKLPGDENGQIYLPIDAKFPTDAYSQLMDAYETGDNGVIEPAKKAIIQRVKGFAKDISEKYISPPETTDFAIMFLPTEGLYAEVIRLDLIETLRRDYKINIAGPTTISAFLQSLQMGFKTLAIQKRSSEVWNVLSEVKLEFGKFEAGLKAAQSRINQANDELEKLVVTRTNVMQRKLRNVSALSDGEEPQLSVSDDE